MNDMKFSGKVAVVTGAGGTLCSCIAIDLAKKGAKVALIGRTEEKLLKTKAAIDAFGGAALVCPCDVTDAEAVKQTAEKIKAELGNCDLLINGAGGNNIKAMPTITNMTPPSSRAVCPRVRRAFMILIWMLSEACLTSTSWEPFSPQWSLPSR